MTIGSVSSRHVLWPSKCPRAIHGVAGLRVRNLLLVPLPQLNRAAIGGLAAREERRR